MRILIIGGNGQLGWELSRQAARFDLQTTARDLPDIDITSPGSVEETLKATAPGMVVNAAAYTQVDRAETDAEAAMAVNGRGPGHVAEACARADIPLIHISTDFVFNGRSRHPYRESDPTDPLGVYGRSKLAGERAVRQGTGKHIIIRTAWLYGVHGHNFVKTMLSLAAEREELRVVTDQHGSPTAAADLAAAIWHLCRHIGSRGEAPWGVYHYCGEGVTSWHGLAREALRLAAEHTPLKVRSVLPIPARQYPTPARRPAYSALDCTKIRQTFGISIDPWQTSLAVTIQRILQRPLSSR